MNAAGMKPAQSTNAIARSAPPYFIHRLVCRSSRGQALSQISLYVFDNHNSIVHNDADSEDESEKGQSVEGQSDAAHYQKTPDE